MIRFIYLAAIIAVLMVSCQSANDSKSLAKDSSAIQKIMVKAVLQTEKYTFVQTEATDAEKWLAVPKIDATVGDTYYYRGGFERTGFVSKELSKTFNSVVFVESFSSSPDMKPAETVNVADTGKATAPQYTAKVVIEKKEVKVKPDAGGITIAELFTHKDKYAGKIIKIKGNVTKYNSGIMKKNWIHIQDGTEFSGKFDLTVTTDAEAAVGQTITLEGKITLNKDFGYGYAYEVLMEDATIKNN